MSEKFVFLLNGDEATCRLDQQILKDNGIDSEIADYDQNVAFNVYRADSVIGKKLLVPESKLKEAKQILNIDDKVERLGPTKSRKMVARIVKYAVIAFLAYFFIGLLVNLFIIIKNIFNI